jgi:hypothetical protein
MKSLMSAIVSIQTKNVRKDKKPSSLEFANFCHFPSLNGEGYGLNLLEAFVQILENLP